jgi:hypothetical protein
LKNRTPAPVRDRSRGRAVHRATAHDHVVGRTGYAGESAYRSGCCPRNGDIRKIRHDRKIGCRPCVTRGARRKNDRRHRRGEACRAVGRNSRVERHVPFACQRQHVHRWAIPEENLVLAGSSGRECPCRKAADGRVRSSLRGPRHLRGSRARTRAFGSAYPSGQCDLPRPNASGIVTRSRCTRVGRTLRKS